MNNPFEKRATEFLRDNTAFLSVVTPDPLYVFFEEGAKDGSIFDRLCMVIGTPGSGKTTIARLLQFETINTIIKSKNHLDYKTLLGALSACEMVSDQIPKVIGCRIPMESEYREVWELPYSKDLKFGLLKSILQSRAVISWVKSIEKSGGFSLPDSTVKYKDNAEVAAESIGGYDLLDVLEKARHIEQLIYKVTAGLIPPSESNLPKASTAPYHPFDVIEEFQIKRANENAVVNLRPLVMLDDVHSLHPTQLSLMRSWLTKRETKISRWMLMRLDAQTPESILNQGITTRVDSEFETTINERREIKHIWLQGSSDRDRALSRKNFRQMAKNMADKYLRHMPIFQREGLLKIQNLLGTATDSLTDSQLSSLEKKLDSFQRKSNISPKIRKSLESEIEAYCLGSQSIDIGSEVKLAMLRILMHRYVKRVPQASLFDTTSEQKSPEPKKRITVDSGVADGARIHLLHEFNRPYYFGVNTVCDASSENAEQFLHLAGRLVSTSEARVIRKKPALLPVGYQHKLLKEKSDQIIEEWEFPRHKDVIRLCLFIAKECLDRSLESNASLGGGANAFGILQEEFTGISESYAELAQVLKFGVAYSAISLKPNYKVKKQNWTLIELTGPFIIRAGLTFSRGGFLERKVEDLLLAIEKR